MEEDKSLFKIPSFAPAEAYSFPSSDDQIIYDELSTIHEEIARCRSQKLSAN